MSKAVESLAKALRVDPASLQALESAPSESLEAVTLGVKETVNARGDELATALEKAGSFIPRPLLRTIQKKFFAK